MRKRLFLRTFAVAPLAILIAALPSASTLAQSSDDTDLNFRRYTVEIIIFSYNQNVSIGTEVFPADQPPFEPLANELHEIEVTAPAPAPHEITRLDESEFTMGEIYDRLRRLDVYRPMMHFGWTQATIPETQTRAQPLSFFATPPPGLDGELTLYLSRFLHLVVDLQLAGPASSTAPLGASRASNWSYPVSYKLSENRIIRTGELRYFDHPKFGLLAKVSRVEELEEELDNQEMLGESELLGRLAQ